LKLGQPTLPLSKRKLNSKEGGMVENAREKKKKKVVEKMDFQK